MQRSPAAHSFIFLSPQDAAARRHSRRGGPTLEGLQARREQHIPRCEDLLRSPTPAAPKIPTMKSLVGRVEAVDFHLLTGSSRGPRTVRLSLHAMATAPAAPTLLLVEDSEDDVILFRRTLRKSGVEVSLHVVEDGRLALHYLEGSGPYSDRQRFPLPDVVLLDLKLPHVHGLDVLRWIRARPEFQTLCVVILTSSAEPSDVETAYGCGAHAYLTKAVSAETLQELFSVCHAPPARAAGRLPLTAAERPAMTRGKA